MHFHAHAHEHDISFSCDVDFFSDIERTNVQVPRLLRDLELGDKRDELDKRELIEFYIVVPDECSPGKRGS
jgi:hypothetical protein